MDIEKLKVTINKTETVDNLWKICEKRFAKKYLRKMIMLFALLHILLNALMLWERKRLKKE